MLFLYPLFVALCDVEMCNWKEFSEKLDTLSVREILFSLGGFKINPLINSNRREEKPLRMGETHASVRKKMWN